MRKTKLIVATALAALTITPSPSAVAAPPRLDASFGLHRGYWVRTDGPWANPDALSAVAGGTGIAVGQRRFARIGTDGKPDRTWGTAGRLGLGASALALDATRWSGRYVLRGYDISPPGSSRPVARVVDTRGRTLPALTAAVRATLPQPSAPDAPPSQHGGLAAGPDGRLWDLRSKALSSAGPERGARSSLLVLDRIGRPLTRGRIALSAALDDLDLDAGAMLASRAGLLVAASKPAGQGWTLRRLRRDGTLDRRFHPVPLAPYTFVTQMLPWHSGAVVVVDDGTVRWISETGRVVHRRDFPSRSHVALDAAGRLLVLSHRESLESLTLRRLRRDGTPDRGFGTLRLRAGSRLVDGLGLLPQAGARLLVAGSWVVYGDDLREDFAPHGTVVWRLRTR
jgi:hypothetical protein